MTKDKNIKPVKKTQEDYQEDALYREVWEDVNNEKTSAFIARYSRHLIAGALVIVLIAATAQLIIHNNKTKSVATTHNYEMAISTADAVALANVGKNASGGTADLALFQSYMLDNNVSNLEYLAENGNTPDFRDLAKIHMASIRGDSMTPSELEKYLSPLNTKKSPFYYDACLIIAQKYLSTGDNDNGTKWLNKIINDANAPKIIAATAETLK